MQKRLTEAGVAHAGLALSYLAERTTSAEPARASPREDAPRVPFCTYSLQAPIMTAMAVERSTETIRM